MTLRIVTGTANSGKTGVAYSRVREIARAGGRTVVLVPSAPDSTRVLQEFAHDVPLGLVAGTLDGFLDRLWLSHGDGRQIATSAQRLLAVEETVDSLRLDDPCALWESRGIVTSLARLVQRAAESRVVRGDHRGEDVPGRLLRAAALYTELLMRAGMVERAEAHRLVLDRLSSADAPDLLVVNRITGLTAAQERLVTGYAAVTEVIVCLTYDPLVPATAGAQPLVSRLSGVGDLEQPSRSAHTLPGELVAIERWLGGPAPVPAVPEGAVVFSEASGVSAEAARIAREVQDACADGMAPDQIAVVFRDPASYLAPLARALREAGIDAEWDAQVPFMRSGLGRALVAAQRFYHGEHAGRIDLLRTPYVPAPDALLDAIDAKIRRTGAVTARRLEAMCAGMDPETGAYLRRLRHAQAATGRPDGPRRWHGVVAAMLGSAWGSSDSRDHELLLDAGAARVFMEIIDGASVLGTTGAQADIVPALMDASITLASREEPNRLQVMGAERARSRRFDCVIIGGLTMPGFPRVGRDDALSAPAVAETLAASGVDVCSRAGIEQERLLFYQVATRSRRRLVLSRQTHDSGGSPLRASVFWEEALDLYRDRDDGEEPSAAAPVRNVLSAGEHGTHFAAPLTPRRALRQAMLSGVGGVETWPVAERERVADAARRCRREQPALGASAREAFARREVFSATEIEAYLTCPFGWYVAHVVRPREIDSHMDAAAAGRLAHEIMYHFYDEFRELTGEARVSAATLADARDVHGRVAERLVGRVRAGSVLDEIALRRAVIHTLRLIEADADFLPGLVPALHEWTFGISDEPEPLGGFLLAGRVDRVDTDDTRLVVTDYKRGSLGAERSASRLAEAGLVQLPLYAEVASRRLDREIAGGVYRSGASTKPRGFVRADIADKSFVRNDTVQPDAVKDLVAGAIARADEAVEGIRAGAIAASPLGGSCPPYCMARGFCPEGARPDA